MARMVDMLEDMRGAAYGAPDPILVRALVRATQELCKRTQCWREQLDTMHARDGIGNYELAAPFEAVVDKILWVRLGQRQVRSHQRPDQVEGMLPSRGFPRVFAQHATRQEVILWPAPGPDEDGQEITAFAALSPSLRARDLPDALVDEYGQGIVARAKADILSSNPGQPWYNPPASTIHQLQADAIFARAKRAQHSGHSTLLSVAPRRFI